MHRKVAPLPEDYAVNQSYYFEKAESDPCMKTGVYDVNCSVGEKKMGETAKDIQANGLTDDTKNQLAEQSSRRLRHKERKKYLLAHPPVEYVLCVGNPALIGQITLSLDPCLNLQNVRIIIEELAEENEYNKKRFPQKGKFLFLFPDNTKCQRSSEYDSSAGDACWHFRGGSRIVIVGDEPSTNPVEGKSDADDSDDDESQRGTANTLSQEDNYELSSAPSAMLYPLLTPSGTHTHTLTSGEPNSQSSDADNNRMLNIETVEPLENSASHPAGQNEKELPQSNHAGLDVDKFDSDQSREELKLLAHVLSPMSCENEVRWRRQTFHEGTRQRFWDKFDAWAQNPREFPSQKNLPRLGVLIANAGIGKTSIVCQLAKIRKETVVACHLCRPDYAERNDPRTIIRSISYQISQVAPAGIRGFRSALLSGLSESNISKADLDGDSMDLNDIFAQLILYPLLSSNVGTNEKHLPNRSVILVDAVDESPNFVKCLLENANSLPSWIGFFLTARPGNLLLRSPQISKSMRETESSNMDSQHGSDILCKGENLNPTLGQKPMTSTGVVDCLPAESFISLEEEDNAMDVRVVIRTAVQNSAMFKRAGGEATATMSTVLDREKAAREAVLAESQANALANETIDDRDEERKGSAILENDHENLEESGNSCIQAGVTAGESAVDILLDEAVAILWSKSGDLMLCASYIAAQLFAPPQLDELAHQVEKKSNGVTQSSVWNSEIEASEKSPFSMSTGTLWLRELSAYPDNLDAWHTTFARELFLPDRARKTSNEESMMSTDDNSEDMASYLPANPIDCLEFKLFRILVVAREPIHVQSIESFLDCDETSRKTITARISLLYPIREDNCLHAMDRGFEEWLTRGDRCKELFYISRDDALNHVTDLCLRLLESATIAALSRRCAAKMSEVQKQRQARKEAREKEAAKQRTRALSRGNESKEQNDSLSEQNNKDFYEDDIDEEEPLNWKDEAQFFALRHVYPYLMDVGRFSRARCLLLNFHWLLARCVEGDHPFLVLNACEEILRLNGMRSSRISLRIGRGPTEPTDPPLELVAGALRLSMGTLYVDPWQLPSQLVGRLLSHAASSIELGSLLEDANSWKGKFPRELCDSHFETAEGVESNPPKQSLTLLGEGLQGGWWCPVSSTLDSPGGPLLCTLTGHDEGVVAVSWCPGANPDGSASNIVVSTGRDQTVRLWNLDGGPSHRILKGGHQFVKTVEVDTLSDNKIDDENGAPPGVCAINAVAWHPSGKIFCTAGDDCIICIWDTAKGKCLGKLEGHTKRVVSVEWSLDGKCIVSGSSDWSVRLWRKNDENIYEKERGSSHDDSEWESDESWREESSGDLEKYTDDSESNGKSLDKPNSDASQHKAMGADDDNFNFYCALKIMGHSWRVTQATLLSADASLIASSSDDETVRIWSISCGNSAKTQRKNCQVFSHTCEHVLRGHDGTVRVLAGSALIPNPNPDSPSRLLASGGGDSDIRIWNPYTGTCMHTITRHKKFIMSIVWSLDSSTLVTSSWDRTVCIWDTNTWDLVLAFGPDDHGNDVIMSVCWAPGVDPDRLITAGLDRKIRVWDLVVVMEEEVERRRKEEVELRKSDTQDDPDSTKAPDETLGEENNSTQSGLSAAALRLAQHKQRITCVKWSPEGNYVCSASADWSLRIWNAGSGRCVHVLKGHTGSILNVVGEGPEGTKLCTSTLMNINWVWNEALNPPGFEKHIEGHSATVTSVEWSPDGSRLASGGCDGQVRVWDVHSGCCLQVLEGHRSHVSCLCWSPDSVGICSGSADRTLRVWIASKPGDDRALRGIRETKTLKADDYTDSKEETKVDENPYDLRSIQDDSVCMLGGHLGLVTTVAWSPEALGKVARVCSGSTDWSVRVWNLETALCTHVLDGHKGAVTSVSWSFDSKRVASAGVDGSVHIWRVYNRTYRLKQVLGGQDKSDHFKRPVRSVCWSSDNVYVCAGTGTSQAKQEVLPPHSVMIWEPSRLISLSAEEEKQALRLKRHRIRNGEADIVAQEEKKICRVGGLGAPLMAQASSLPRRWRAHFVHAQNNAPEELLLPTDATIGFSDDYDSSGSRQQIQPSSTIGSGLHVCPFNMRHAFKLSQDTKTLHLLRLVGGDGMCHECEY